ncbi:hypothetical protein [uncultured Endozoicomonas sp.]|uniref:hypothetical protein n=1 Tax=uncultured Endozoicomonas sp. TaxID=432652 RepID=UPI00260EC433|nr:hypothetical protein [uncultured Endozoicomonas sp.]
MFFTFFAFHGADGCGEFGVWQLEQVAGFHGLLSTSFANVVRLGLSLMDAPGKAVLGQGYTKETVPFYRSTIAAKCGKGTIWYRFLGLGYNKIET